MTLDLSTLPYRPIRHLGCDYASVGTIAVHRFPEGTILSNSAWAPGDPVVQTVRDLTCSQHPDMPRVFPPRFQWCTRPARDGYVTAYQGWRGHLNPWDPGEQGGADIHVHPPATPNIAKSDAIADRSPVFATHRHSGLPLTRKEIGNKNEYRLDRLGDRSLQQLPCFGADADVGYVPHDQYHGCRSFFEDLAAWRTSRSMLARLRILMHAEDYRMSWWEQEVQQTSDWVPFTLARWHRNARTEPGKGQETNVRGVGHTLRLGVTALEVGTHLQPEWEAWIRTFVQYTQNAQGKNGAWRRGTSAEPAHQNEPWAKYTFRPEQTAAAAWEQMFLIRALWEAQKMVPDIKRRVVSQLGLVQNQWTTCPLKPPEHAGWQPGLPLYICTDNDTVTWGDGLSRSEFEPDAMVCFEEAGVL